ncbi:TadE/TadG family type IV pilus assembly protein [Sinomonas flava]|uniref:TadE-like domain-containing protein n=1 Tax=Sinomonas flava TaxID=496857 RepID=A0ABN3BR80_9MICC
MSSQDRERGAAAVEFALVLPVLILLLLGIVDYGRLFNAQQTLTYAARSGARVMVLQNSTSAAITAAQNTASDLGSIPSSSFAVSPSTCTAGTQVTFTVNYTFTGTGFFGSFPLQGKGVMLCGG